MRMQADWLRNEFRTEVRAGIAQITELLRLDQRLGVVEDRQHKQLPEN